MDCRIAQCKLPSTRESAGLCLRPDARL